MAKLIKIRKPKVRITTKGVRVSKPSARIGGKTGLNISSQGVSGSVRTGMGTYNTKKGCSLFMLAFPLLILVTAFVIIGL